MFISIFSMQKQDKSGVKKEIINQTKRLIKNINELPDELIKIIKSNLVDDNQFLLIKLFVNNYKEFDNVGYDLTSIVFSNNQFALSCSLLKNTARLWIFSNLYDTDFILLEGHTLPVNSLAFSSNNKYALTGSDDGLAKLWDLSDLGNVQSIELKGPQDLTSVAFNYNNKFALTDHGNTIRLWNLKADLNFEQLCLIVQLTHLKNNNVNAGFLFDDELFTDIFNSFDPYSQLKIIKEYNLNSVAEFRGKYYFDKIINSIDHFC